MAKKKKKNTYVQNDAMEESDLGKVLGKISSGFGLKKPAKELLSQKRERPRGRPRLREPIPDDDKLKSYKERCAPGWRRLTVQVKLDTAKLIKRAAFWANRKEKEIVEEALSSYLKKQKTDSIPGRED